MNYPHIKLYAKLSIEGRCRTSEECLEAEKLIIKENNLNPNTLHLNQFEFRIIPREKLRVLKFKYYCSFYENKTLEEMKEDKARKEVKL